MSVSQSITLSGITLNIVLVLVRIIDELMGKSRLRIVDRLARRRMQARVYFLPQSIVQGVHPNGILSINSRQLLP